MTRKNPFKVISPAALTPPVLRDMQMYPMNIIISTVL